MITKNKARQLLNEEELSNAPLPAYQKIDSRYFDYNIKTIRGLPLRGGLLLTTRGCPFQCTFCGCNLIFGKKLRFRHIDRVKEDIDCLCSQHHVEGIWILDDTFTVNKTHAIKIARLLKTKGVIWGCQSRVDTVTDDLLKIFKECGCVQIDYGVESGSPRILTTVIKKGTNPDQIRNAFKLTKKHGIRTLANIMIGLPTETLKDLWQTQKIVADIQPDVTVVSIATPLPGTELYGIVGEDISPSQYASLNWNGSEMTSRLNKSEIKNIVGVHHAMKRRYLILSVLNALHNWQGLSWFLSQGDKWRRIKTIGTFFISEICK
ncbi:MAG: radical SAM protein [Kiritimatiellia bacterium]|nr:radical SAM protein [Kiritimatiellia bacterium]